MPEYLEVIPGLFRTEYSKITAVLCAHLGIPSLQVAQDITSETFTIAMETWSKKGLPSNQRAWLYKVAKNKALDYQRRSIIKRTKIDPHVKNSLEESSEMKLDLSDEVIKDSQLRMIFAICHPSISQKAQIALALRVLCGFQVNEIASALLARKEAINKRLFRAKKELQRHKIQLESLSQKLIESRLPAVLKTIYLLYNEGYYSATNEMLLRKELCIEAMRLLILLEESDIGFYPEVSALLALTCFHSSRIEARTSIEEHFVSYYEQSRDLWDHSLIEKGEKYLNQSSTGDVLTSYHVQAGIAYWHTQPDSLEKWNNILQLYNYLLQIEYSHIAALNRTYSLHRLGRTSEAIQEAKKLGLKNDRLYFILLAELYKEIDREVHRSYLSMALSLSKSQSEKNIIRTKWKF